jgi:hypothetical protein
VIAEYYVVKFTRIFVRFFFRVKATVKLQTKTIVTNLVKVSINAAVDNYFFSWVVTVYFEETV